MTQFITLTALALLLSMTFAATSRAAAKDQRQALTPKEQCMVTISAFTANGDLKKLKPALVEGLEAGLTVNQIKEILVQMYAYAGFPRSLNGLATFMGLLEERQQKGISDEAGKEASPLPADINTLELGTENQTRLVGKPVVGKLFTFSPAIDRFLKAHLFGDIFARDILDWKSRELTTIAALCSIRGVNPQLAAHFGIGMHNGLTVAQLRGLIAVIKAKVGKQEADNAAKVLDELLKKRK
ncbi:MAG: carboxymuconolactone decarboxylase family protein [Desulfarculaceae bacterium]